MEGHSNSTSFYDTFVNKTVFEPVWICPNLTSTQAINYQKEISAEIVYCEDGQTEFDSYAYGAECSSYKI